MDCRQTLLSFLNLAVPFPFLFSYFPFRSVPRSFLFLPFRSRSFFETSRSVPRSFYIFPFRSFFPHFTFPFTSSA